MMISQTKKLVVRPDMVVHSLKWRTLSFVQVHESLALWRRLEQRIGETSVANSAVWIESWLKSYGDVIPYQIAVFESHGAVRGMCLITEGVQQKEGPFHVNTVHIGTAGEPNGSVCVEYNRILVETAYRDEFISGLVSLMNTDDRWEQLRLDGFSDADLEPWLEHLPGAQIRHRESRYFDFEATRTAETEVIDQLGRSTRANLRRRLKQYGELTCEWAENVDQAEDIFHELIELHQARWKAIGQPGAFANPRFLKFQAEASLRLFLENKAVLFRVRQQDETIGCLLLLNDRNRLLDYLSGFASFEEKPSPGLITHYLCMGEAMRRGYSAYDFLVGDKRHKDNLSNQVADLCWLTWSRPNWKFRFLDVMRAIKHRIRRPTSST